MANVASAAVKYLRESKEELQKVSWPTQKEIVRYSTIVVVFTVGLGILFGAFDWVLNEALNGLLSLVA